MSEQAKFTPGPWMVHEVSTEITVATERPWKRIDRICSASIKPNSHRASEGRANAHLIAAAPCMYEALKNLVRVNERPVVWSDSYLDAARAALAKAEGRA